MSATTASQRGVWLAIILLGSVCAAVASGVLFHAIGAEATVTLGVAGGAFVGVATLGLTAHRFMTE